MEQRNGRAFIQVSKETGDNCIVLYPGTNGTYTVEEAATVLESFSTGDWIVQQNEISHGGEIMKLAAEKGLNVFFNPAPLTKGILQEFPFDKVTILVVNEHEAQALYEELGGSSKDVVGLDLATELLHNFGKMQGIVITLGGAGVVARFRQGDQAQDFKVPSRKVNVKDTTGAGDTFVVSNYIQFNYDKKPAVNMSCRATFWLRSSEPRKKTIFIESRWHCRRLISRHLLQFNARDQWHLFLVSKKYMRPCMINKRTYF